MSRRLPAALSPDPLRLSTLDRGTRRLVIAALAAVFVALAMAGMPVSWLTWSGVVELESRPFGPFIADLLALALIAVAARLARSASIGTRLERPLGLLLGVAVAALCGNSLRSYLQVFVLRRGWRPQAILSDPARAFPTAWMYIAGFVLLSGFLVGLATVVGGLAPRVLRRSPRYGRVGRIFDRCANAASWVPAAAVGLFLVGHSVLGPDLMAALGTIFPAAGGFPDPTGPQIVFEGALLYLATFAVFQFGLAIWGATEVARLSHDLAPSHGHPRSRTWSTVVGAAAIAAFALAAWRSRTDLLAFSGHTVAVAAVVVPLALIASAMGPVRNARSGHASLRSRSLGLFPSSTGDLAIVVPIAIAIGGAVAWTWAPVIATAISNPVRFPSDAAGFRLYWQLLDFTPSYGAITVEQVVRPGLIAGAVIAGANFFDKEGRRGFAWWAFPLFVGMAFMCSWLEEPGTFLLIFSIFGATSLVLARLADGDLAWWPPVLRVGALSALAIAYLLTPDFPLAALLAASILLRFGWQAGSLNMGDQQRPKRIGLALALAMLLTGLLLAEESRMVTGLLSGQQFATVGQHVGIAFFAIPIALALGITSSQKEDVSRLDEK